MAILDDILERVTSNTNFLNSIIANAKKIFELPAQTVTDLASKIHVSNSTNDSEYVTIQQIINQAAVGGGSRMMKFNFASLILSTTVNQWRTGNYNSSVYDDAVRNNVTGANPIAGIDVGAQQVYKTGTITKIILKSIRSSAFLNIDAKFHIGKFEKPDGEVGYLNEIQVAQESFVESSASFGIGFIKEMTIANASVTEGDFIYFAVANNTTTATTLLGFEATLIIE